MAVAIHGHALSLTCIEQEWTMQAERTYNVNVIAQDVLMTPAEIKKRLPITPRAEEFVVQSRAAGWVEVLAVRAQVSTETLLAGFAAQVKIGAAQGDRYDFGSAGLQRITHGLW